MNYAVDTHGRDLVPGKGSSVEGEALLSTYSALVEPCTAAKRINEILDWIGVKKEERDITITIRDSGMEYSMMSMDDNTVGFLIDSISSVPDLLLRLTTLKPGDGAAGVKRIFFERAKEGRRFAPKTEAKLEKVAGLAEAMERTIKAISVAQVWQMRVEEMLTKAGIIDDGRFKPKSAPSENASARQIDVDKMAEKIGVTLRDVSIEDANDGVRECIDDMVEHVVAKLREVAKGPRWEHKMIQEPKSAYAPHDHKPLDLNAEGADGWELASVVQDKTSQDFYFRRQLPA